MKTTKPMNPWLAINSKTTWFYAGGNLYIKDFLPHILEIFLIQFIINKYFNWCAKIFVLFYADLFGTHIFINMTFKKYNEVFFASFSPFSFFLFCFQYLQPKFMV